jgi:hypothetical protein
MDVSFSRSKLSWFEQQIVTARSIASVERALLPACLQRQKRKQAKVLAPHKQ